MPQEDDKTPVLRDFKEPNHTRVENAYIFNGYAPIIGSEGMTIYTLLCCFWNQKTNSSRVSIPKLKELSGLSRREIIYKLEQLTYYNIIRYIPQRGRGKCNVYFFPHCSTWKPIEKSAHHARFNRGQNYHNVVKKGAHHARFSKIKGAQNDIKKVHHVHPFKRSSSFKGSGGCSEDLSYSNIANSDLQKTPVPENGNSASKNVLKQQHKIVKNLPESEDEIQRQNFLKDQAKQILQERTL